MIGTRPPTRGPVVVLLLLFAFSCISDAPRPFVGDCADYPDGTYDYGQIGVGSCLAGPVDLRWFESGGETWLAVTNSNPFLDFASSSVATLPLGGLPLDGGELTMSEAGAAGVEIPNFAASAAWSEDQGLLVVPSRFSDEGRLREENDDVWFVSLSDPAQPALAGVAEDGASFLRVQEDPTPAIHDPASGLTFVGNSSAESISVIDLLASPVEVIDAVSEAEATGARVFDVDRSGSRIEVADLGVERATLVPDEDWTLTYTLGTFRAWVPSGDGVRRITSYGRESWDGSAVGVELDAGDSAGAISEVFDPQIWSSDNGVRMAFGDVGSGRLMSAVNTGSLSDWAFEVDPMLEPRADDWDAFLGGPMALEADGVEVLFYDGVDAPGTAGFGGIGMATSRDGLDWDRAIEGMLIAPGNGTHDLLRAADPYVFYDPQARHWRMYYSAFDGTAWTIGHASSLDLAEWEVETSPVFVATEGTHAAAPVLAYAGGWYRMWTTREDTAGDEWLGLALSRDGWTWEDQGLVTPLDGTASSLDEPRGVGLQPAAAETWSVTGETTGAAGVSFMGSEGLVSEAFGWSLRLSTGWWIGPDGAFDEAANGVEVGSFVPELDRLYVTLTGDDGIRRIGSATWNDGQPVLDDLVLLEGGRGSFDADGVSSPVVFPLTGGWGMVYAGHSGALTQVGLATSTDGVAWATSHDAVLEVGSEWDSIEVVPGSVVVDGGDLVLYYTGSDGEGRRIGVAVSADDGASWTRQEGERDPWTFDEGAPGEFDDNMVQDPWVLRDDAAGVERLFYAGNDGANWRIGLAERALGDTGWDRLEDPLNEETVVLLQGAAGSFDVAGALRPVVVQEDDGTYTMLYNGEDSPVRRVGVARGSTPENFYREPRSPSTGDTVEFVTRSGDSGSRKTIPLDRLVDGYNVSGTALSAFALDEARGVLLLASSSNSYVLAIDIRDDSEPWFEDNPFAIEAVLDARTNSGAKGFRSLQVDGDRLYALNDSPESVMVFDLDVLEDDHRGTYVAEAVGGYLVTPRGAEQDQGSDTSASVGPSGLALNGSRLYVTNFNENSVGVYDLGLGVYGSLIDEIANVGENPHAVALSPDGTLLAVANIVGDTRSGSAASSLVIIDVDQASPTYLDVLARVTNQ